MKRILCGLLCISMALGASAQTAVKIDSGVKPAAQRNNEDTLRKRIAYLTRDELNGAIAPGSYEEQEVSEYLYDYLIGLGMMMLSPRSGDDFGMADDQGDTLRSRNIVGIIPGFDPGKRGEYVLVGSHIDGGGADDNASGIAVLMQIAQTIAENKFMFGRSVIIAFFGAGTLGNAGSWYFLNRSFPEADKISLMIDINSVGGSGADSKFQVFNAVAGSRMLKTIKEVGDRPFSLAPAIVYTEPFSSDYRNFYERHIPVSLFSTGNSRYRGTHRDTREMLDYFQMTQIAEYIYSYAMVAANLEGGIGDNMDTAELPDEKRSNAIFTQHDVDKRATFMKGDEKGFLRDWVYEYLSYPSGAVARGAKGEVQVEFIVDKDGNVKDVKVRKGIDEELDAEAVKVIKGSPKWTPATLGGENVSVRIVLPVEFRLTKSKGKFGIKK